MGPTEPRGPPGQLGGCFGGVYSPGGPLRYGRSRFFGLLCLNNKSHPTKISNGTYDLVRITALSGVCKYLLCSTLILFVQTEGKVFSRSDFFSTVHFTDAPKDRRRSCKIANTHSGSQTLQLIHRRSSIVRF